VRTESGLFCAIAGAMLLFAGTWLHPMPADPNKAVQAFAAYADDRLWVASHLVDIVFLKDLSTVISIVGTIGLLNR
jgi:hypothetical protein